MSLEQAAPESHIALLRLRVAWFFWFLVLVIILMRSADAPAKNNCFLDHYKSGGTNWFQGNDLYQSTADTCRYSPLIHAFLVPFSVMSDIWGSTAWRLVESLALMAALGWWLRAVCPTRLNAIQRSWIVALAIPLAIGSMNNGQSNVLMIAGLLAGMAAVSEKRWMLAALAIAFASFFKIYPLALAMILIAMYPRQFGWRFLLAIGLGLLLPFFLQNPSYVYRQYGRWLSNLQGDDRSNWDLSEAYRDVWMLIRISGTPIAYETYRIIQVAVGAAVGLLCIGMRYRGDNGRELLNRVLGLACCWMTAFGPATESPTYILLTATLAWLLLQSWLEGPRWMRLTTTLSAVLFFSTVIAISTPYGRQVLVLGPQPIAALLIFGTLIAVCLKHPVREVELNVLREPGTIVSGKLITSGVEADFLCSTN